MDYDIESHWSRVAVEIRGRETGNHVAGDDDPYYRYKRDKFLRRFLATLDVAGQRVLELGCGPGGNLLEVARRAPASLVGIDISATMLALAGRNLEGCSVELKKADGQRLPLEDRTIDLAFTVTVLQHNVDPARLSRVIAELCRVTAGRIVIMEDTGDMITAAKSSSWVMRSVGAYQAEFERHGFHLESATYLNLRHSRRAHAVVRRLLMPATHREGEPSGAAVKTILAPVLTITRRLDDRSPDNRDLTKMVFVRRCVVERAADHGSRRFPG